MRLSAGEDHRQPLAFRPVRRADIVAAQLVVVLLVQIRHANVLAFEVESEEAVRAPKKKNERDLQVGSSSELRYVRVFRRRDVKLFEIEPDALKVLLVLQTVDVVFADDAGDVGKRVVGAVDDGRRAFAAQDRLVAFRPSVVFAVFFADEI